MYISLSLSIYIYICTIYIYIYICVYNGYALFLKVLYLYLRVQCLSYFRCSLFIFDILTFSWLSELFFLSLIYWRFLSLENDILRLLNPPRARHTNGLATWSSLIGNLYINARLFSSFLHSHIIVACNLFFYWVLLSFYLTIIRSLKVSKNKEINTNWFWHSINGKIEKKKRTNVSQFESFCN